MQTSYKYYKNSKNYSVKLQHTHTRTRARLTALCPGLPRWAGTRKVKPIWILLKHKTVSGSGISWAICKSAPRSRQITTPAPHHSVFTGRVPFLPPNQQRQSTVGQICQTTNSLINSTFDHNMASLSESHQGNQWIQSADIGTVSWHHQA